MFIKLIGSLFTGGIAKFFTTYQAVKIAQIEQNTKISSVVKELELERLQTERAASIDAKQIRFATKDFWEVRFAIALVAIPTSFHYACVVIDSIYDMPWQIAALPTPLDDWQGTIILSYFGLASIRHGVNAVTMRLLDKRK